MGSFVDVTLLAGKRKQDFVHNTRIKSYPNGTSQVLVCDREIFGRRGWEAAEKAENRPKAARKPRGEGKHEPKDVARSVRRARAQVRDYALCTPFKYFVTLTLDKAKVDRYNVAEITKKLRVWADNQVRRKGLAYILVPERHKDGAIHFHGFFNGALEVSDSGTMTMAGWKQPRRPRSAAQRREWEAKGAHPVYNLPAWTLGFTTAIELYGTYEAAVSYVCKYIGKGMDDAAGDGCEVQPGQKIGGRWYYSGGALRLPEITYCDSSIRDVERAEGAYRFDIPEAGLSFVQITCKGCSTNALVKKGNSGTKDHGAAGTAAAPGNLQARPAGFSAPVPMAGSCDRETGHRSLYGGGREVDREGREQLCLKLPSGSSWRRMAPLRP